MSLFARDVALYLQSQLGIGTLGTDIFYNQLPSMPHNCIAVLNEEMEGSLESSVFNGDIAILIRNVEQLAGDTKALAVYNVLHDKKDILPILGTTHTVVYSKCHRRPEQLKADPQGRYTWIIEACMYAK